VLERAKRRDVQLRNPAREHEHPVAAVDAERGEHAREAIGLSLQLGVGEFNCWAALAEEPQGDGARQRTLGLAIHGLVADVQSPAG
jgi:hypothetical protein